MLSASGIRLVRDSRAILDDVSISLEPGELHVILGPNGAGKSSLLEIIAGLTRPDAGVVSLNGRAIESWPARTLAQYRAFLPQRDELLFDLPVAEVVAFGTYARPDDRSRRVQAALADAGAQQLAARGYQSLSTGERARVRLARVFAQITSVDVHPAADGSRVLMLDEPIANLDLVHQHRVMSQIHAQAQRGIAVLAVVHDPNLALRHASRITLLRGGRVLASGKPEETLTPERLSALYDHPVQRVSGGEPGQDWIRLDDALPPDPSQASVAEQHLPHA